MFYSHYYQSKNAERKMLLQLLVISGCLQFLRSLAQEVSLIRHVDGDIFMVDGSCTHACIEVSGGTASPYNRQLSVGLNNNNATCICQCNSNLPLFREDLNICVNDIHECGVSGFLSSSGTIEKVPYVFLPQCGQIVYPQAEIQFEGVKTPVCGIAGAQQLGKAGWSELRNISSPEPPFRLFRDEGRVFLRWTGETGLREATEGKVVVTRLTCRDAAPDTNNPRVFTPCVAFRIAGSPSKSVIREVSFAQTSQSVSGLSTIEYTAIGISSVLLALIYVVSVSLYLHSQKSRRKKATDPELIITPGRDGPGVIKNNPLLAARHFDSESNSIHSESDHGEELGSNEHERCFERVTSAIIHPHSMGDHTEGQFGSAIIAERIPDEDVRIVETIDNAHQDVDNALLPGIQRRKLYFNPAYFDRQLLLAPPPAAIEFLLKIREVIAIAKHKMTAKRFVPILAGIPEEESRSERCSSSPENKRASSVATSKKTQRCTGCPGCMDSRPTLPVLLPDNSRQIPGDSRVRAWLAEVRPPEQKWRDIDDDHRKNFQENVRTFARSLEQLRDPKNDFLKSEYRNNGTQSLATWKNNPPMLRTFQNIARSEIIGDDDRHSYISKKSTKSMFEDTNYDRFCRTRRCELSSIGPDDFINAKVRKAIENSFIKQMEENAALENQMWENERIEQRFSPDGSSEKTNLESLKSLKDKNKSPESTKRKKKTMAPPIPLNKELPDMITELPVSKLPAKKIMDAVIKEMLNVKALDNNNQRLTTSDYEVDSLERTNRLKRESKQLPQENKSSSKIFTEHNNNEEINKSQCHENETMEIETNDKILRRNYYNSLPELISQRPEGYSLVSEVYVNDGYASPANSDDSGPEISYEPENPGHLTIKVQDSPENYVKQADSEYEPDTLDRKPMRLKINGDVMYEKDSTDETYVDSLERPAQISLKSRGSFRSNLKHSKDSSSQDYASLREIYEAKLNSIDSCVTNGTSSSSKENYNNEDGSWKATRYLTPDQRQARRQRKKNQPDVVPLPPPEGIYQYPKPPRRVPEGSFESKNERDRRISEAGIPTAGESPPVRVSRRVGINSMIEENHNSIKRLKKSHILNGRIEENGDHLTNIDGNSSKTMEYDFGSVSETDETESFCDGASESGAESVGTDSVFFGNFRKLSGETFTKSIDSGVDIGIRNSRMNSSCIDRQASFNASDSENESFVTVLPHGGSRRNSLVL